MTEEGRVWVQRAGGAALVRSALALLTSGPYRRPLPPALSAPAPSRQALYIVRTLAGDWYVPYLSPRHQLLDQDNLFGMVLTSLDSFLFNAAVHQCRIALKSNCSNRCM